MYCALLNLVLLVASVAPVPALNLDDRYNFFDVELLQTVCDTREGNVVLAPASVKVALTTLVEGTGGRTTTQILSVLRLPFDQQSLRATASRALAPLKGSRTGVELDLATRLWTGSEVAVNQNYVEILRQHYGGEAQTVNFGDAVNSAQIINDWVRLTTRGHIQSLVDPGGLDASTKLLLTNALYLKGNWMRAFNPKLTTVRCFRVPNYGCQNAYFMESSGYYPYAYIPSLDADVIELPYADGKLSMLIFLPDRIEDGILGLSRDLAHTPLSAIVNSLRETDVLLSLPKFTVESKLDLRPALERLGIKDLFDINANVSGIVPGSFRVGNVLHNAKIEINEEGTIAAAVSGISVVPLMGSTVQRVRVDHPFMFIIRDSESGAVLFAGRVNQPDLVQNPPIYTDVFGKPAINPQSQQSRFAQ